jgi:transposase
VRVWLSVGRTDMRRGMNGLSLQVQETLGRDPFAGDLFVFRGKRGDQIKILWHDGLGLSLYVKRLERGTFVWPSATGGSVSISAAQLAYMLDGIDWRKTQFTHSGRNAQDSCAFHERRTTVCDSFRVWIRRLPNFPTISMRSGPLRLRRSPRMPTMRRRLRARTWRSPSSSARSTGRAQSERRA